MTPVLLLAAALLAPAADPAAVSFADDVKPILQARCVSCHGATKQKGGLRLDRKADALKGGDTSAAVVPGKPNDSLLLKKAASTDDVERMPPTGNPLTAEQIGTLGRWIEAGAVWPDDAAAEKPHWAFQPVKRPEVPTTNPPSRNPIDVFVRARLNGEKIAPNPPADRRALLRRLKFDLLGLPPTPEEVEAFEKDTAADAYEQRVEKYLASPQFGERWARHWLDAVRFAESHGFEMNQPRPNAWPYRDWVIRSVNDDLPYDRFVYDQLAGDTAKADAATGFLVAGPWDQVKSPDRTLTLQQRADELHDIVGTTAATFLGLTVGCARCHAHKFDPVPQADYYRLKAVFAGVLHGERELRGADISTKVTEAAAVRVELAKLEAGLAAFEPLADPTAKEPRRAAVTAKVNVERFAAVTARFLRFDVTATNNLEPCLDELEAYTAGAEPRNVALATAGANLTSSGDYPGAPDIHRLEHLTDGKYGNSRSWISNTVGRGWVVVEFASAAEIDRVVWGRDRQEKFADRLATKYRVEVSADGKAWTTVASSADRAAPGTPTAPVPPGLSQADRAKWDDLTARAATLRTKLASLTAANVGYVGRFAAPEPTFRLHRGDATVPKEAVAPGVLSEIGPKLDIPAKATDPERRAAFAKWLTDPANPLPARVVVNRLWQHHFGTGLVDTPSDFGRNGGKPSHPELLDWLASELVKQKWSLKAIHRLIVTSETYRRSSASTADGLAKDAQARLLWRYPPRRLEAEAIRDSILFVSGKLDLTAGGPGFDLFEPNTNYVKVYAPKQAFGPAEFRRMVYQAKPRMQADDTFAAFDCPDGGQIAPKRNRSTTPLQALNLLNGPFTLQQADFFAARVTADGGKEPDAQVRRAFALAFQRSPSDKELSAATALVKGHGLAALCRALLNANEFLYSE